MNLNLATATDSVVAGFVADKNDTALNYMWAF